MTIVPECTNSPDRDMDWLWLARNRRIFDGTQITTLQVVAQVIALFNFYKEQPSPKPPRHNGAIQEVKIFCWGFLTGPVKDQINPMV